MAVRVGSRLLHSALWASAGLFVALAGLFMSLHESTTHNTCVVLRQGIRSGTGQARPDCGFTDTVYWAGIVLLVAGGLSTIAVSGAALSAAARPSRASGSSTRRGKASKSFGQAVDPTDPATRWKLDRATDWRPGPAGWQAGPSAAVPFVPPVRRGDDPEQPSVARNGIPADDIVATSPPPAWYADPERQGAIRWWDGNSWGESRPNPS